MRVKSMTFDEDGRSASITLQKGERTITKSVRLHKPQDAVARGIDERFSLLLDNLLFAVTEAHRDFLFFEAKEKHGSDWRSHCDLKSAPDFGKVFATWRV